MSRLHALWMARTARERAMLALLAVVAAGVGLWLAVAALRDWREAADRRLNRAMQDHVLVLAGTAAAGVHAAPTGGLDALIRDSAARVGLEPVVEMNGDGAATVSLDAASSSALFAWVADLESRGVRIAAFTALKTADGALQARLSVQSL